MKLGKTKYFALFIMLAFMTAAYSQQIFGVSYDISVPTADTRTFIPTTSILGFGLDGRQMSGPNNSFGIAFHWNSFSQSGIDPVESSEGGDVFLEDRTYQSFPILVSSHYYFGEPVDKFRFLIGGNAGTYFIITRQYTELGRLVLKNWHFGLAPDVGFIAEFIDDVHILFTLRYNYAFKTASSPSQSYFSFIVGFVSVSLF